MFEYFIRSTVLGGEVVSDLKVTGDKQRSYVIAGGAKLAEMSYRYTFGPSQTHDTVNYFHQDAAGMSQRVTRNSPENLLGTDTNYPNYTDPRHQEYDPSGGNTGTVSGYTPTSVPTTEPLGIENDSNYMNGQVSEVYVDGVRMPNSMASNLIRSQVVSRCPNDTCLLPVVYNGLQTFATWSAYADGYAGYVPHNASYQGNGYLSPVGLSGPPGLTQRQRRDTDIARLNGVGGNDERHLRSTREIFPWYLPSSKFSTSEVRRLRQDVGVVLNDGDCLDFISNLIANAKLVSTPTGATGNGIPEDIIDANPLSVFDKVASMGGFYSTPLGGLSSIRGMLNEGTATVYLTFVADSLPAVAPGGPPRLGGRVLSMEDARTYGRLSTARNRAVTTIHELLHFNFSDEVLSSAVSVMTGSSPSEGGLLGASRHWANELRKHCN